MKGDEAGWTLTASGDESELARQRRTTGWP
jgi:hypothetical protein